MIKKQKEKQTPLVERSPYMYYVTNWGFFDQPTKPELKQNQKR